jgi:hypothetical protein
MNFFIIRFGIKQLKKSCITTKTNTSSAIVPLPVLDK